MPQGTVAVRVVLSTQVTFFNGVPPSETVGVAAKSAPVMVTGVSMSLGDEAGATAAHAGVDRGG